MEINLTLMVQAINFFLFYLILRVFVFKPFVAIILQDEADKKRLESSIQQERQMMAAQEGANKQAWQAFQQQCELPTVIKLPEITKKEVSLEALEIPPEQRTQLLTSLKQALIKKVTHVR